VSRESHRGHLERAALREAQKAFDPKNPSTFDRQSFSSLRIQTVEPWKRIVLAAAGALVVSSGFVIMSAGLFWTGLIFAALGVGLLTFGLLGRRKPIDATLDGIDVVHLAAQFFDAF
jgi:hypothetical protein